MRSRIQSCRYLILPLSTFLFVSCADADRSDALSVCAESNYDSSSPTPADIAWEQIFEVSDSLGQKQQHSYHRLLVQANRFKTKLRKDGLKFWCQYPDDPRRYTWLQLTVHLSPSINNLGVNDRSLELAPELRNAIGTASEEWTSIYPKLRDEFWFAESTTDADRRFLWFGEIVSMLTNIDHDETQADRAREALVGEVLEFWASFPKENSAIDSLNHRKYTQTLFDLLFTSHRDELGISRDRAIELLAKISEIKDFSMNVRWDGFEASEEGRSAVERLMDRLKAGGDFSTFHVSTYFSRARDEPKHVRQAWFSYDRALALRGFDGGSNEASRLVDAFHSIIDERTRHIRTEGFREEFPSRHFENRWLFDVSVDPRLYPKEFVEGMLVIAGIDDGRIEFDRLAYDEWMNVYSEYRGDFLGDQRNSTDTDLVSAFLRSEMNEVSKNILHLRKYVDDFDIERDFLEMYYAYYLEHGDTYDQVTWHLSSISRKGQTYYGMSEEDVRGYLGRYAEFEYEPFDHVINAFENRMSLSRVPFELSALTLDGQQFRVSDLRGNIVLVDHWNTSCSSCIAAMPYIEEVRKDYAGIGFKVVSLAYDATSERKLVQRIKDELQLDAWITVDAEPVRDEMFEKYDIWTFPQYMLLRRDGSMYAGTYEVDLGRNLPMLLDELIEEESQQ